MSKAKTANTLSMGGAIAKSKNHLAGGADKSADADTAAASDDGKLRGGAKKVVISEMVVLSRGGKNVGKEEPYPFTELGMSQKDEQGAIVGPSFFIPESDGPNQHVATARKRVRGQDIQYITRKVAEIVEGEEDKGPQPGLRVWKAARGTAK